LGKYLTLNNAVKRGKMSYSDSLSSTSWGGEGREPGTRRRKLAGYLKAANEIRQSYQQQYTSQWSQRSAEAEDDQGIPGAFPDVAIVRSGDEEMVLFPSYARRHVKKKPEESRRRASGQDNVTNIGDHDEAEKEWKKYEDDHTVVDVDVRGWIYSPHKGPMTRRNRLLIGLARTLSGIPASAPSDDNSRDSSRHSTHRERIEDRSSRYEEELVSLEAQSIMRKGEGEADVAWRGGYSERPGRDSDRNSVYSSRSASPDSHGAPEPGNFPHPVTESSMNSDDDDASIKKLSKRSSWNQPADMTPAELKIANSHLMSRLKPFLTNPVVGIGITAFFWNEESSQSRSSYTNESGHFSFRASLDFVPTNVRVLASENLSAAEEVQITDPTGISLISDIDDTIKHSGIGSGAKEIFRNTFIRDLGDLTILGVNDWYSRLAEMGVQLHYVSNSPWQLFPVLKSYFTLSGLPPGSFHLKQYNGMLQGIFEPVAERKKGTIEKIIRDFPERQFLLVGDSGEADLEVYTDIVTAYPTRILGVFIRDVTTPEKKSFFDQSLGHLDGSRGPSRNRSREDLSNRRHAERESRPALPARRPLERVKTEPAELGPRMGTLIDFGDGNNGSGPNHSSQDLNGLVFDGQSNGGESISRIDSGRPVRPSKPFNLRSSSESRILPSDQEPETASFPKKGGPPPPPKPRRLSNLNAPSHATTRSPLSQEQHVDPDDRSDDTKTYTAAVRDRVTSAYNKLPSPTSYIYGSPQNAQSATKVGPSQNLSLDSDSERPPPVPPRRALTSYPASAAQYASNRISSGWTGGNDGSGNDSLYGGSAPPLNKKVELWKRRWDRAKTILEREGVMLKSWRVGADVMSDAIRLVEKAAKEGEKRRR
jgi:phosphatidate phosphatase APP1